MMENRLIIILTLFITAEVAVTKSEDNDKRIERSPCRTCGVDGPPFGPLPPPGYFRAHQWSGLARNGDHHGVFSGASAAIGGRPQAGGEAISLAATGDDGPSGGYGDGGWGAHLNGYNTGAISQSSSSSQSMSSGGQTSSSASSGTTGGQSSAKSESSSGLVGHSTAGSESRTFNGFKGISSGLGGSYGAEQSGRYSHSTGFNEQSFKSRQGGYLDQPLTAGANSQALNSYGSQSYGFQDGNFDRRYNRHDGHRHHGSSNLNEQSFGSKIQSGVYNGPSTGGSNVQSSNNFDAQSSKGYGDTLGRGDVGGSSYHNHQKSLTNFGAASSAGSSSFGRDQSSAGQRLQSSNAGGFESHSGSPSLKGYSGFNGQNSNSFGGSSSSDGHKLGGGSDNYALQEFQSSQSGKLDAIGHINSDTSSHGYTGSQQQSKEFGFGQQQSTGLSSSGLSAGSSSAAGGIDASSKGDGYYKSQSALKGALNLASQGLETSGQNSGCSTCGKGSYALSNARSESGNAVAVSVSG